MSPAAPSQTRRGAAAGLRPAVAWALLALFLAAGLVLRLPVLCNAAYTFTSDEAVNALVVKHLLEGRELTLFNWDATYFGIVEGLLAVPFVWVLGFTPLAFKLGAVVGFLGLQVAVFLLGRRLYGPASGLAAAALLAAFSPQLVLWSTLAAAGYCLLVGWGTLTIVHADRLLADPSRARVLGLGLMLGFGLYIYQLYVVYLVVFALWGTALALSGRGAHVLGSSWRERSLRAGLLTLGFAAGWLPKLALLATGGGGGGKAPGYGLVALPEMKANLALMLWQCIPALFGVNPATRRDLDRWVGPELPGSLPLGVLLLAVYLGTWAWAALRTWRRPWSTEALLVLLPPVAAGLFVVSPNAKDVLADRFLLPALTGFAVLAGDALVRLHGRSRAAAIALAVLLIGYPVVQLTAWHWRAKFVDGKLRPVRLEEPLYDVLGYLDRQGMRGAYGCYWTGYKATMLAGERIVVAPLDWDRYAPYSRAVARLGRVAYVFRTDWKMLDAPMEAASRACLDLFLNRLDSAGKPYVTTRIGAYRIYHGPGGARLLPPSLPDPPEPLTAPRADVALAGRVPASVRPGERFAVPVEIANRSDARWSTTGLPLRAGALRVDASYRWFLPSGEALPLEGERSLLPGDVRPGESLRMRLRVLAPPAAGTYDLRVTLVQEGVAWFDQATGSGSRKVRVEVR
jgi:hypothetical protein